MNWNNFVQAAVYLILLILMVRPLGIYMARVYRGKQAFINKWMSPVEKIIYRICGGDTRLYPKRGRYNRQLLGGFNQVTTYFIKKQIGR